LVTVYSKKQYADIAAVIERIIAFIIISVLDMDFAGHQYHPETLALSQHDDKIKPSDFSGGRQTQ
jgi:hypothetical protein